MREQALVSRRLCRSLLAITGAGTFSSSGCPSRVCGQGSPPAVVTPDAEPPAVPCGVASGDASSTAAMIWSRTDRPRRLIVEQAATESFKPPQRVAGPAALAASDFTARVDLTELPPDQEIFCRVRFQGLPNVTSLSVPVIGQLRTTPSAAPGYHVHGGEEAAHSQPERDR